MKTAAPEKITVKYSVDFWLQEFEDAGLKFERAYAGNYHYVWHCCGDFHIGYERHITPVHGLPEYHEYRQFIFMQDGKGKRDTVFEEEFEVPQLEEYRTLLRAIVNPKLMPLCIGMDWASEIVTFFLQRSAA